MEVRGHEPGEVEAMLKKTESWEHWMRIAEPGVPSREDEEWPSLFDYPEIAEDQRLLGIFFKDLLALEREAGSVDPAALVAISEAARFLGAPEGEVEQTLAEVYAARLGRRLGGDGSGESRLPGSLAVALAVLLPPGAGVDFLYPAGLEGARRGSFRGTVLKGTRLWLVGTGGMLWLLGEPERRKAGELPGARVVIAWSGQVDELSVEADEDGGAVVIRGGSWQVPVTEGRSEDTSGSVAGIKVTAPGKYWGRGRRVEAGSYLRALHALADCSLPGGRGQVAS
ncbi:MAG: hypothetical protein GWO24_26655 [Akkermansiaceae bacterium]|nr:hypothetical protein [Akkermansiaceae bacterium]